eukprot:TRINITY_DN11655_c0_g1_i1.p1 TRINITY_DN11655_c0_g1~~TRINITY_DN11655_c0_g1_i1.p1  ORF type:complete len:497 (-),score=168.96 TRINITY_DN11655_c0_g1_i1:86-1576(-)
MSTTTKEEEVKGEEIKDEPMTDATEKPKNFSLPILKTIKECQMSNGLRHDDYEFYRRYCTRRLRRLRENLRFVNPRHHFKLKVLEPKHVIDARYLCLPLMKAERAWAYAMQLKNEINDNINADNTKQMKHHLLERLRKAAVYAKELDTLCAATADQHTQIEASAYRVWMESNVDFEENKYVDALQKIAQTKIIYENLCKVVDASTKQLCVERIKYLDPILSYCQTVVSKKSSISTTTTPPPTTTTSSTSTSTAPSSYAAAIKKSATSPTPSPSPSSSITDTNKLLEEMKNKTLNDTLKTKIQAVADETRKQQAQKKSMDSMSWLTRIAKSTNSSSTFISASASSSSSSSATPLMDRLSAYDAGNSAAHHNLVTFPPDYQTVPCKPIMFDLALNGIQFPSIAHRVKALPPQTPPTKREQKQPSKPQIQPIITRSVSASTTTSSPSITSSSSASTIDTTMATSASSPSPSPSASSPTTTASATTSQSFFSRITSFWRS